MLDFEIIGTRAALAKIGQLEGSVRKSVHDSVQRLAYRLQIRVQSEKLSGQVLKVQTGTLRRSIDNVIIDSPSSIVGVVSTNLIYGRAHEYGYSSAALGPVTVKEHLRTITQAFGKPLEKPLSVKVSAHSRNTELPEKSFLRSALKDMQSEISTELSKSIGNSV